MADFFKCVISFKLLSGKNVHRMYDQLIDHALNTKYQFEKLFPVKFPDLFLNDIRKFRYSKISVEFLVNWHSLTPEQKVSTSSF